MLRDGRVCDECITAPRSVVRHRCVRGSTSQSLLYWLEAKSNQWLRRYSGAAAGFIAPSRFIGDLHVQVGIPEERVFHVPNFVHLNQTSDPSGRDAHFLFAGRLSVEKGLDVLLEAMEGTDLCVKIAGDGPLRSLVEEAAARCDGVEYLGMLGSEELHKEYARCRALVVPSICYENASIVVLEAFAAGTPVIASDIGGLPEQVQPGKTGWLFPPGDASALREAMLASNVDEGGSATLGAGARKFVEENHSPERYLERLVGVYEEVQRRCAE
jgi:glycosyltransferase involved in cell wall biosynthesis